MSFHPVSAPDYLPRAQMQALQLSRLQAVAERGFDRVELLRTRMRTRPQLCCLQAISGLPFTTKADLRDTYPFGLFASPIEEVVRLHASSGTTGKPIVVAYTRSDVDVWSSVMMRSFAA